MSTYLIKDADGSVINTIVADEAFVEEHYPGRWELAPEPAPTPLEINISNTVKPNIQSLLASAGWDGAGHVRLVVDPNAKVNTLTIPALNFPNGLYLYIGAGALVGGRRGSTQPASDALTVNAPITIENHGAIKGGGGRGGDGANAWIERYEGVKWAYGGGGGYGEGFSGDTLDIYPASNGDAGYSITDSSSQPGGSFGGGGGPAYATGGTGGRGGNWRQGGYSGGASSISGNYVRGYSGPGYSGVDAGKNIVNEHYVTWVLRGDA